MPTSGKLQFDIIYFSMYAPEMQMEKKKNEAAASTDSTSVLEPFATLVSFVYF